MIRLRSLTKRYGRTVALDAVDLEINRGEAFGLLGPNGAGKSTLLSLLAGLTAPDAGTIEVDGRAVDLRDPASRRVLGLVPQHLALYPAASAQLNLEIFGSLYGLEGAALRRRIDAVLQATGLLERRRDAVRTYSGGMKRRLNLAATLLHEPAVLLCDEPTVGVDPQSRLALFEHLEQLVARGTTLIYTTHYMEEAERLCRRIAVLDHGRILALGTREELAARLPPTGLVRLPAASLTPEVRAALASAGVAADTLQPDRPRLESLFLHLTGRDLRD